VMVVVVMVVMVLEEEGEMAEEWGEKGEEGAVVGAAGGQTLEMRGGRTVRLGGSLEVGKDLGQQAARQGSSRTFRCVWGACMRW